MEDLLKKIEESFNSSFEKTLVRFEYGEVIISVIHKGILLNIAEDYHKLQKIKQESEANFDFWIDEALGMFIEKYNKMATNVNDEINNLMGPVPIRRVRLVIYRNAHRSC